MIKLSDEIQNGLQAYSLRIAELGGYGVTVIAKTVGRTSREVLGVLVEAGFGGCQPVVCTSDGKRYMIVLETARTLSNSIAGAAG